MQLASNSIDRAVILGSRNKEYANISPDIDLFFYGGEENAVEPEHLIIYPAKKTIQLSPSAQTSIRLNQLTLEANKSVVLEDSSLLFIGNIIACIEYKSVDDIKGKTARTALIQFADQSMQKSLNIEELLAHENLEHIGQYPKWIVDRAERLKASSKLTLKTAIEIVLATIEAERNKSIGKQLMKEIVFNIPDQNGYIN